MQQSSECDSSGRLCMDSDAVVSTYSGRCMFMCAHVCIGVCVCHVNDFLLAGFPLGASLLPDITKGSSVLGNLLYLNPPAVLGSSSSPSPPPPPKYPPNRNVIKKGRLWPPLPETVHTNHIQPFRRKTCRVHTSHFHLQKSSFFIEMKMRFLSLSKSARQK